MTVIKAVACGLSGNELSKEIMGSEEVSPKRTVIATTAGAALGATVATGFAVAVSAPVSVPLCLASATIAGLASIFD